MALKGFLKKYQNLIGTGILLLIICIFAGVRYDYYYDLNDDVLMKDILAGVYTGTPEGHNIQMLWPVSAFISLCYRIGRGLPWYGMFLCLCHYGSIGLIVCRSLRFCQTLRGKLCLLFTEGILIITLFLGHLVSAQYTVTCTLLAGAAAFLFFTTDSTLPPKEFIKKNLLSVLLVTLAFLIRSEMLLLVLPMICAAGVIKWGGEKKIFTRENSWKYLTVIGGILAGIAAGQSVHMIAYSTPEWKTFTEYFDNRTELYDFQTLPEYEPHQGFYESIGLTESERTLLANYNFGLDEEIDEKLLGKIAEYAAANRSVQKPFWQNLKESMKEYLYRTGHGREEAGASYSWKTDYPWNYMVIFSYLAVFVTALLGTGDRLWKKAAGMAWKLAFLGAVRTALWMYIIMRDRVPPRISHSLYLMELCILAAMLFMEWKKLPAGKIKRYSGILTGVCFGVFSLGAISLSIGNTDADTASKGENNLPYEELQAYFAEADNQENFYFIDVYSSVSYTEKMFVQVDNSLDNYDIMGGWACKSPLQRKKLKAFGIDNMEEAILKQENVYYVQEAGADMEWLYRYYGDHQTPIRADLVKRIGDSFEIYDISPKK